MYIRGLQGYEHALGPDLMSSYIPALNTMFAFNDLFSRTDLKDMAKTIYTRAFSGYTTVRGASSGICKDLGRSVSRASTFCHVIMVLTDRRKGNSLKPSLFHVRSYNLALTASNTSLLLFSLALAL
jgi:hypothetical protein